MCDLEFKRKKTVIQLNPIWWSYFFPSLIHFTHCIDIRPAWCNYKHQQPIKRRWMGQSQMSMRHPPRGLMCDNRTKTWAGYWPLKEEQSLAKDLCSLILDKFGKQVAAILCPLRYLLYIALISVAWFIRAPAVSMKYEATQTLLISFTSQFVLFFELALNFFCS